MNWWHIMQSFCQPIALYSFGLCMLLSPYIYFSIGLKFDEIFKDIVRNPLDIGFEWYNKFVRSGIYAAFIAFPKRYKQKKGYYQLLNGYNFRQKANRLQIIISKIYFFLIFTAFSCGFIGFGPSDPTLLIGWFKVLTRQCTNC